MKNIDFLPESYRQRRKHRRDWIWWCAAGCVLAAAITSASSLQWFWQRTVMAELAIVEVQHARSVAQNAERAKLDAKLTAAQELGGLYLYLRHPWPRTQLLAAIAAPLPQSIRITSCQIGQEAVSPGRVAAATRGAARPDAAPDLKAISPGRDLAELRAEHDTRQTTLEISGTTRNVSELHAYVDALGKSPLISSAHLKGIESPPREQHGTEVSFQLRLVVRPGYGQPGAPQTALLEKPGPQTSESESASRSAESRLRLAVRKGEP